ncbi:MAG: hypothetical protein ACLTDF_04295 [Coprococcus sp.]
MVDPATGTVRAMVSCKLRQQRLTNVIDPDYYAKITEDKTAPMYNRATMQRVRRSTYKSLLQGGLRRRYDVGSVITDYGTFSKVVPSANCWLEADTEHLVSLTP